MKRVSADGVLHNRSAVSGLIFMRKIHPVH
jgi:hypothetical protein